MIKRLLLCCMLLVGCVLPSRAVLKEKNLNQSLAILKLELQATYNDMKVNEKKYTGEMFRKKMLETMEASDQTALMLYSQKMDYVFDLTYACNAATTQYKQFNEIRMPFTQWVKRLNIEISRYNGLVESLGRIPSMVLDEQGMKDKDECIELASNIRKGLVSTRDKLTEYKDNYTLVAKKLKVLNDYAEKRYRTIRQSIFINGGSPYWTILGRFGYNVTQAKRSLIAKYASGGKIHSEWRGSLIIALFIFVAFYMLVSGVLSLVVIRWVVPKRFQTMSFLRKRSCIILAASVWTFAAVLMVMWAFFLKHSFFLMASGLLIEYAWLVGAILLSLLIRLHSTQIRSGFRIYLPIMFVGMVVIVFRIILIPNELVALVFPPILLACTVWQWKVITQHNMNIPRSDMFYTWTSLAMMVISTVVAWIGYTLLSVQILIWWLMMLTCIQTITLIYDLLSLYEKKHIKDAQDISQTWFYDFICKAVVPILAVGSLMISLYWAAHVFELTEWCETLFTMNFIDLPDIAQVSILKLSIVIAFFFIVRYLIYAGKSMYILNHQRKNVEYGVSSITINVVTIFVWGCYVIISMIFLHINNSGIFIAVGGLSTGIGFAMKDTLENLFYGISLMTGRVKIGDMIECDGVRGRVTNINYQSTMVETLDGSVMAFLNSQLFNKNFKNLTKNHGYELVKIPVGVAYGTDVKLARTCIEEKISELDCYNKKRTVNVMFDNFGDNSVDLILVIWIPVATKLSAVAKIKEAIYETFNAHGIEIPFPQRDVYIRQIAGQQPQKI